MGRRVRVIGGPWAERIGCEGVEVDTPPDPTTYPFAGCAAGETVVLLDSDPLNHKARPVTPVPWTCVVAISDLEFLP